ncbi:MAG: SDR family NAD(P)-dependent oxidoreductase [Sarcina sp.]
MKYTVITGASAGIGRETAKEFAKRGKNLVVVARREEELNSLKNEIKEINNKIDVIIKVLDLGILENVYKLYDDLKELEIETWVNNAGFGDRSNVADQNLDKIHSMIALNIEALTVLSTLYVRDYQNVEGTQLLNISSAGGYTMIGENVTYCATKFYVSSFTEGLAKELEFNGAKMKVKVLAPAATETEFAVNALDINEFSYKEHMSKYHTANEMAKFLMELYDNEKVVGIVNGLTYEYNLVNPMFNHARR